MSYQAVCLTVTLLIRDQRLGGGMRCSECHSSFFVKYNHQQKQFVFRLRHSGASPHMLNSTSVIQQLCLATTADSPPVVACDNNI